MKITVSFKNMEHTPSLDDRINEKTGKLNKYLEGKSHAKWSCYVKDNNHYADVDLVGPHFEYHATAHSDSLYKTIDMVVNKLEKQLSKKKDKVKNKMHRKREDVIILEPSVAWMDHDDEEGAA